ncbi:phosphoribosylglycinamide formyltransferase [Gordonia sp. (in: high G+C Gram-positive bacteria)]|uniref:phosphoribosylglycinamide formyltransferase n=1 Tax=Gordonia sp. (in: high G+C Gram-positive bacteria) TaxID=84139 RepID=UPI0025C142A8|nr:phosphoribosylglycinamide formyltransferase [Gordonia sp. (in: high G+C Gram-positive bacteria)]
MASGTGSLMAAILELAATDSASFRVVGVVVDRDCAAADRAIDDGISVILCQLRDYDDRDAWDRGLTAAVDQLAPEWVVTAGFMKILGPSFLARFGGRILNSHPALLPAFPGAHGVADALAYGVKVTGTTVHLVDDGVDTGPILAQRIVEVLPDDTQETLHERIKEVERMLLPETVHAVVTRGVVTDGRKAHIK